MTSNRNQDFDGVSGDDPQTAPRHHVPAPTTWPHYDGPLHGLLEFQGGQCAVCSVNANWGDEEDDEGSVSVCSLRQWVEGDLLLGLACARCLRRYKTLNRTPEGSAVVGLPLFLADPPGQRCPATAGLGQQSRPRRFNSLLAPTQVPTPETWTYSNTVIHSLFLWQRGRCAICSTGLSVQTRPRYVHVDHDDASGLIRGLLCHRCNICLGQKWELTFWEHHAPTVQAYLAHPPAQICPATRGLTMAQRKKAATLTWSADRHEILLDGMPKGIATPKPPVDQTTRWFAIRYDKRAPLGLPPAVEASLLIAYLDDQEAWLAFLMEPPASATHQQRNCILRMRKTDVVAVSEHGSLQDALTAALDTDI